MTIKELKVQRFSVTSSKVFHDIVAVIEAAVGRPDMREFARNLRAANTLPEMEQVVGEATGPSELMELTRMDLGEVLRKRVGTEAWRSLRLIVGNHVIMSSMVEHVPDAGSYAPVTILIDEDRKIEGGKIATQCLYRATMQYNCVALQLQNLPAKG